VSWNINQQAKAWQELLNAGVDVALLQEAKPPPSELASLIEIDQQPPWITAGAGMNRPWCAAIVGLSNRIKLQSYKIQTIERAQRGELAASRLGTLAVADVEIRATGEIITVVSMYGAWESPVNQTKSSWIYADASVHRVISDLSTLIGQQKGHKIVAAGDLNILYGYGEGSSAYWKARYKTIFARFEAIGLCFLGPQAPEGGEQTSPWPDELPTDSLNVPTYRTQRDQPDTATRQLDFVFASESLADRLRVRALNQVEEWGVSDHCRIMIEINDS
jgi:endonuclease/exonuclease/phosphatase family metal-dependent hydrolase